MSHKPLKRVSGEQTQARPEDKAIESFVDYLSSKLYAGLHITDWPDKIPGSSGEIDAIARSATKQIAIEHTSLDSLPNQRRDDARFMEVFGPLEMEFHERSDLRVCLVVPFGAVPTGLDWNAIRSRLRDWIVRQVPLLPHGTTEHNIPDIPFSITVVKPSGPPRLWFARFAKNDPHFSDRLRRLVNDKAEKLAKYGEAGYHTILLLENGDLANMNRTMMITAVEEAYRENLPVGLNRIWYADTSISDSYQFWNITPNSRTKLSLISATEELENPPE